MTREEAMLKALGNVLNRRLAELPKPKDPEVTHVINRVDVPEVTVTNEVGVPGVSVAVDMAPVAAAIGRMTDAMLEQSRLIGRLIELLSERKEPVVNVAPQVEPPAVSVRVPDRPKRKLRITHEDGTETVVSEE